MKTIFKKSIYIFIFILSLPACNSNKDQWELNSPDGRMSIVINSGLDSVNQNQLSYQLNIVKNGVNNAAVSASPLGILREDGDFTKNLTFLSMSVQKNVKVEYQLLSGKERQCKNIYNELILEFRNKDFQPVNLIFRIFNDGMAFCYKFPGEENKMVRILKENSGFNLPGATGWMHAYDAVTQWSPAYLLRGANNFRNPFPSGKKRMGFSCLI
jgi:hypothetical protein